MKTILTAGRDFIIEYKETPKQIHKDGKWQNDYTTDGRTVEHITTVDKVLFYEHEYDENGKTDIARSIYLNKDNIIRLAERIKEIEANRPIKPDMPLDDDLPF